VFGGSDALMKSVVLCGVSNKVGVGRRKRNWRRQWHQAIDAVTSGENMKQTVVAVCLMMAKKKACGVSISVAARSSARVWRDGWRKREELAKISTAFEGGRQWLILLITWKACCGIGAIRNCRNSTWRRQLMRRNMVMLPEGIQF